MGTWKAFCYHFVTFLLVLPLITLAVGLGEFGELAGLLFILPAIGILCARDSKLSRLRGDIPDPEPILCHLVESHLDAKQSEFQRRYRSCLTCDRIYQTIILDTAPPKLCGNLRDVFPHSPIDPPPVPNPYRFSNKTPHVKWPGDEWPNGVPYTGLTRTYDPRNLDDDNAA